MNRLCHAAKGTSLVSPRICSHEYASYMNLLEWLGGILSAFCAHADSKTAAIIKPEIGFIRFSPLIVRKRPTGTADVEIGSPSPY